MKKKSKSSNGRKRKKVNAYDVPKITEDDTTSDLFQHLTEKEKGDTSRWVKTFATIIASTKASMDKVGFRPGFSLAIEPSDDGGEGSSTALVTMSRTEIAETLKNIDRTKHQTNAAKTMARCFEQSSLSNPQRARKINPMVPMMGPEDVAKFLRTPIGSLERPCSREKCVAKKVKGFTGKVPRELLTPAEEAHLAETKEFPTRKPICILCHDCITDKIRQDNMKDDPKRKFKADKGGSGATRAMGVGMMVNIVQYKFGPEGYNPYLMATNTDREPIPGLVGRLFVFSLGHFAWYEDDTGFMRISDKARLFYQASASM